MSVHYMYSYEAKENKSIRPNHLTCKYCKLGDKRLVMYKVYDDILQIQN